MMKKTMMKKRIHVCRRTIDDTDTDNNNDMCELSCRWRANDKMRTRTTHKISLSLETRNDKIHSGSNEDQHGTDDGVAYR